MENCQLLAMGYDSQSVHHYEEITESTTIRAEKTENAWNSIFFVNEGELPAKINALTIPPGEKIWFHQNPSPKVVDATDYDISFIGQSSKSYVDAELFETVPDIHIVYGGLKLSSGKYLVWGRYTSLNGPAFILQFNADGTLDTDFNTNIGTGPNERITKVAEYPDGKILVAGWFTTFSGVARSRMVRLNVDGTIDATFTSSAPSSVWDFVLLPDGKIVYSGEQGGTDAFRRMNADGTADIAMQFPNARITSIIQQSTGRYIVFGFFSSMQGNTRLGIAAINENGGLDNSLIGNFRRNFDFNYGLYAILLPNDKILVWGDFTAYNGDEAFGIIQLNADGTRDTSFNGSFTTGAKPLEIIPFEDKYLVLSTAGVYNGKVINRLFLINADGSLAANQFGSGLNTVNIFEYSKSAGLVTTDEGIFLAAGYFSEYNGQEVPNRFLLLEKQPLRKQKVVVVKKRILKL